MIHLSGRIDSENAAMIEEEIVRALTEQEGDNIIFDASKLDYISSAGLYFSICHSLATKTKIFLASLLQKSYLCR